MRVKLQCICIKSGWLPHSVHFQHCRELFIELWRNLQDTADENTDGEITVEEWVSADGFNNITGGDWITWSVLRTNKRVLFDRLYERLVL